MTPEQIAKIFLPFEQVGETRKQSEGTGLGLAIGQRIAQMMGSQLQVRSHPGVGSVFTLDLVLPAAQEWVEASQIDRHTPLGSLCERKIIGIQGKKPTLLIADDDRQNRSIVANLLEPIGVRVVQAENGCQAWEILQTEQLDLLISDLRMSEMDGVELIHRIRSFPPLKHLPIIVSSASVFARDRQAALEAGGNDFLPKPVPFEKLIAALQKFLYCQWIYEDLPPHHSDTRRTGATSDAEMAIVPPNVEVLDALYDLAMRGNLKGIERELDRLALDDRFVPFVERMRQLTKGFQVKKLRESIQSFRQAENRES